MEKQTFQCLDGHLTRLLSQVLRYPLVEHCELALGQHIQRLDVLPRKLPLGVDPHRRGHGAEWGGGQLGAVVEGEGCVRVGDCWLLLLLLATAHLVFLTTPPLLVRVVVLAPIQ